MLEILKNRFNENMDRHPNLEWEYVESRLKDNAVALKALRNMEESGGEPDTIGFDEAGEKLIFCDCSKESPTDRRSLCYDDEALQKRKKNPPTGSAVKQATEMGIELSWIHSPESIRKKGGALFCERRYGRVFTFHNGADSYYSSRGFRGYICV